MDVLPFLLTGVIGWYLCGEAMLGLTKRAMTGWVRVAVAIWIGISFFIGLAYFAAIFSIRWAVLPVMVVMAVTGCIFLWKSSRKYLKKDWWAPHWFLIPLAFLFSVSVTTSGWMTDRGLILRGVNAVDGMWNLALAEELIHTFPPQHPAISGVPLRGYHLLYNLLVADLSRLSGLSTVGLHFHFLPMVMSLLMVYGIYALCLRLTRRATHAVWATFFALAGGSFAYVLPIVFGKSVSLDDALGITQPFSLLVSPSFVLSLLSIIYTWIFLDEYDRHPNWFWGILTGMLAGLSVGMKVYAGMILLPTIGWFVIVRFVKNHDFGSVLIAVFASMTATAVFFPLNASYGYLRYQPLWPPHRVMQGVLDFTQWELKRQTLEAMGAKLGLIKLEAIALAIFIFGNLGTRLVGLVGLFAVKRKDVSTLFSFLIFGSLVSFILPMFFLQPIGAFNMIQFFWYFLVFMGLLAGWGWAIILGRVAGFWKVTLSILMIVMTIPSAAEKAVRVINFRETPYVVPKEEINFYKELRSVGQPGDVVLVVPTLERYAESDIQGWFYRTGPTIPAFTGKRTLLGNEVVQFPYDEWIEPRVRLLSIFLLGFDEEVPKALQSLRERYTIRYVVIPKGAQPWFIREPWLRMVFVNDYGTIYEVSPLQ